MGAAWLSISATGTKHCTGTPSRLVEKLRVRTVRRAHRAAAWLNGGCQKGGVRGESNGVAVARDKPPNRGLSLSTSTPSRRLSSLVGVLDEEVVRGIAGGKERDGLEGSSVGVEIEGLMPREALAAS